MKPDRHEFATAAQVFTMAARLAEVGQRCKLYRRPGHPWTVQAV